MGIIVGTWAVHLLTTNFFKMPGGIPEGCSRLDIGWHIKLGRGLARFIMTEH